MTRVRRAPRTWLRARQRQVLALVVAASAVVTAPTPTVYAQTPVFPLDTVRVEVTSRTSSALPAATRGVQVVTANEIARTPARTVPEVLSMMLALDVLARSPAQADVSIRGGSFEQVLVLVDGVPMGDPQTGHFDLDLAVPLAEVERIEVLRGGASALYGSDAMTGVINVVTRRGGSGWEASARAGSFGTWSGSASGAGAFGGLDLRGGAEWLRSDGHRPGTDHESAQVRVTASADLAGGRVRADAATAKRDFGAANFYAAFPSYEETRTTTGSLSWAPGGGGATTVSPSLSFRQHGDDFVLWRGEPERYQNLHTSQRIGGEVVVRHAWNDAVGVAAGGEAYRDRLESSSLGDHSESRTALFTELSAGRAGLAALTAGLRYDHHDAFGGFLAPSAAVAVWPRPEVRLRVSATRGFRGPTLNDRYYQDPANVGTPDLLPERSHELEAGADLDLGGAGVVSLGAFRRSASDLIDWARPAAATEQPWRTLNVSRAVFRGVEAEYRVRGPAGGRWSATAAFLSFESSGANGYVSKYALRPLQDVIGAGVEQPLAGGLALSAQARRQRRTSEEAAFLLDGRLTLQRGSGELFVEGRNLTDARYRDVSLVPGAAPPPAPPGTTEFIAAPGRSLAAGVSIRVR